MDFRIAMQKGFVLALAFFALLSVVRTANGPSKATGLLLDPVTDDNIVLEALNRALTKEEVKTKWKKWRDDKKFTEKTTGTEKEITFVSSDITVKEIFHYLQYFPLLENGKVKFTIPIDGKDVKLLFTPDQSGKFDKFNVKYLYEDPNKPGEDLNEVNNVIQETITTSKQHPELLRTISSTMRTIFESKISQTEKTFEKKIEEFVKKTEDKTGQKPRIEDKDREKAFRNAMETMICTSVLRRKPTTWITDVTNNLLKTKMDSSVISGKDVSISKWNEWKRKGYFVETPPSSPGMPKEVTFKYDSSVSPTEIFHVLQHFDHLEKVPIICSVPFGKGDDGKDKTFKIKFEPDASGGFKAIAVSSNQDLSNAKSFLADVSKDIHKHNIFQDVFKDAMPAIFNKAGDKKDPKLVEKTLEKVSKKLQYRKIPRPEREAAVEHALYLVASSIVYQKEIPEDHAMSNVINEKILPEVEKFQSKRVWEQLKTDNKLTVDSSTTPKTLRFSKDVGLSAKTIFQLLKYYPTFESESSSINIPIDGKKVTLKIELGTKPKASYVYKDETGKILETDLSRPKAIMENLISTSQPEKAIRKTLEEKLQSIMEQIVSDEGTFKTSVTNEGGSQIPDNVKNKAFRHAIEAMASTIILGKKPKTYIDVLNNELEVERGQQEVELNTMIKQRETRALKLELASSMLGITKQKVDSWGQLVSEGHIKETKDGDIVKKIVIDKNAPLTLKETFKLLQHFNQIYPNQGRYIAEVQIPIGGEDRTLYISKASRGIDQLLIYSKNRDWPGTKSISYVKDKNKGKRLKTANENIDISYKEIIEERALNNVKTNPFAKVLLDSLNKKLIDQPNFDDQFKITQTHLNNQERSDVIRGTVEFLLISMVGEAAAPPENVEYEFKRQLAKQIIKSREFPAEKDIPSLEKLGKGLKAGRSPTADEIVIKLLNEMTETTGIRFDAKFNGNKFPFMINPGGTKKGREYIHSSGDQLIPASITRERAATDSDGKNIAQRARMSCTGSTRRRRRDICSIEEIDKNVIVDEKSIKVEDNKITVDIVSRRDATKRRQLEIPISSDDLATSKLVQEKLEQSARTDVSPRYAKVNRGLAIHGMVFSAIGAIDYFKRGDNARGGIAVTQSLHSLGGLTGFNKIASSAAKQALRHSAFKIAKGLKMEEGLARFSGKVEKFMEKGVGRLMGDLPGVGLAFDIYFIKEDIDALSHLDLNNPQDVKMLPLRVVDLVLDVDTTVLNLIGTFCPAAEVITEPLIIVLSIVRMAIDDFYVDIMEEMDKVNWNSPWAGFQFIGALFKGIINGAIDFLTGGLRRQMENYSKQEKADQKFVKTLKDPSNYYKITATNEKHETIDFTQGKLSSFGGFINFRMMDNGYAHLEVGDVEGKHDTIKRTFKINKDVTDIVLGIGESRKFVYKTKTAKLWMFIPVKDYKVINSANLRSSSLYGIYYGNSEDNSFYAVQGNQTKKASDGSQNDYGKFNINFATGHYHYDLYGRGGNDVFYLGPQLSHVTGGLGSDVYIIQSYGGNTIIDNFSEDKKRDMVIIKVNYEEIYCLKKGVDLEILYKLTHHIRISNWFVPGSPTYYRHISFKSLDGIIFLAKDFGKIVKCTPIAIEKSDSINGATIDLLDYDYKQVKQVVGSQGEDTIIGNDLNNILDGGKGADTLIGGLSEDTYIIRANEGCDRINNYADDFKTSTDVILFNVPYERITLDINGNDLFVYDNKNATTRRSSCFSVENWNLRLDESYRHFILTSLDHVVFKISTDNNVLKKVPMVLDYSKSTNGVKVDLHSNKRAKHGYVHNKEFQQVATVSDSKHDDHILGNNQSNFLSCTGGNDFLYGLGGSDNYIIKKSCKFAVIINWDPKEKVDLLLIDYAFQELTAVKHRHDLIIYYDIVHAKVNLRHWYSGTRFQHLWMRTKDGITVKLDNVTASLDPVEISKDPVECQCQGENCERTVIEYDLNKDPWKHVTRFQLNSSLCSYTIKGNALNNYIDPGSGNGYNYQILEGRLGADTYVLKHGYGEFNVINNFGADLKTDTLKLGMELNDIDIFFREKHDVILTSKTRPTSLAVRIKDYFFEKEYQHLQIVTSDQVTFEIQKDEPFMRILTLDLSRFDSPQKLSSEEMRLASTAQTLQGVNNFPNEIQGSNNSKEIDGGEKDDVILGGPSDNIIDGKAGNDQLSGEEGDDILFGGDGNDVINGGDGNDYIYGGEGQDSIDGGPGDDTMVFRGDGFTKTGVNVDLSLGYGKGADAEGDTYKSIEHVYGTIHNDVIIGSDSNNNLYGTSGDDVIVAKGGSDKLVGGDGSDRYVLEDAFGVKFIDNFSEDKKKDTLSLSNIDSKDVCIFLDDNDLHFIIKSSNMSSVLYGQSHLTVIIQNWKANHTFRHLNILFKNTYWKSHVLAMVKDSPKSFAQFGNLVTRIGNNSDFKLSSYSQNGVSLSWKIPSSLLADRTKLQLFHFELGNKKNINTTLIPVDAVKKGHWVDRSLKPKKHYLLALFLKHCSTIISSSHSLEYYGEQKSCTKIEVEHSTISYNPEGSLAHGTTTTLTCQNGYKLQNGDFQYKQKCIDGEWFPKNPTCMFRERCRTNIRIENGYTAYDVSPKGVIEAVFTCDTGFRLRGSPSKTCEDDGKWPGKLPKCEPMRCLKIPNIKHGKITACENQDETRGTLQDPKENFCVNLTCDKNYIEHFKHHTNVPKLHSILSSPIKKKSNWQCINEQWEGLGKLACLPSVRLDQRKVSWHEDHGVFQQWDENKGKWENSLSSDVKLHKLACSNSVDMEDYDGMPKVLKKDNSKQEISCPKVRFFDTPYKYEGSLEVLVNRMWQPTCLLAATEDAKNAKKLKSVYMEMCHNLGLKDAVNPGIAYVGHGVTSHVMQCKENFKNVDDCLVKPYPMTNCIFKLQCRRRCNDAYRVPNGSTQCTGKLEMDKCNVECNSGLKLAGERTVVCKKGVWSKADGSPATSRCDPDHEKVHKKTNKVVEQIIDSLPIYGIPWFG